MVGLNHNGLNNENQKMKQKAKAKYQRLGVLKQCFRQPQIKVWDDGESLANITKFRTSPNAVKQAT